MQVLLIIMSHEHMGKEEVTEVGEEGKPKEEEEKPPLPTEPIASHFLPNPLVSLSV